MILKEYVTFEELLEAYYECRKNKRKTINALDFEIDYINNLYKLKNELNNKTYKIGRSITFLVYKPVLREIFASDFRDRIVQHLVINRINNLLEDKCFIDDTYSCRVGKGTLYGIKRLESKLKEISNEYTEDCYILKCDIKSFFMSIDKTMLYEKICDLLDNSQNYLKMNNDNIEFTKWLFNIILFNEPQKQCIRKGKIDNWKLLPKNKSLFNCDNNHGLPIGNITSQILANYFLSFFDDYVTKTLGENYYGRYVDDFYILNTDKHHLINLIPILNRFLNNINLTLHPNKIYIQHYSKGLKFIGAIVKPNRIYIGNRTKGYLFSKIHYFNTLISNNSKPLYINDLYHFSTSINSYLGFMVHFNSYNIRKKFLSNVINKQWFQYIKLGNKFEKIILKTKYNNLNTFKHKFCYSNINIKWWNI